MADNSAIGKALSELLFKQREEGFIHASLREEMRPFELMKQGDPDAAVLLRQTLESGASTGTLSPDPLRHCQYLLVSTATIACRTCIQGGMAPEVAYGLSDLYIQQADQCDEPRQVADLQETMIRDFAARMKALPKSPSFSLHVLTAMDYIDQHLHEPIRIPDLAANVGVSVSYLSALFAKEAGKSLSRCIREKKLDASKMLLAYSDFSVTDIAQFFSFASASHYTNAFRAYTGLTPLQYRKENKQQMPIQSDIVGNDN